MPNSGLSSEPRLADLWPERLMLYLVTFVATAAATIALPFSSVHFSFDNFLLTGVLLAVCGFLIAYAWLRNLPRLAAVTECCGFGLFLTIPILIASYIAASFNMPLVDDLLTEWDEALGFSWHGFIALVDSSAFAARLLMVAYVSIFEQMLLLPVVLIMAGRAGRAYRMISAYGVLFLITCFAFIWFPALGTYPVYKPDLASLQNIDTTFVFKFLDDFLAVRALPRFDLSMINASGIITMPSGHAAVAFLCAWATWDLKALRTPMSLWNALMAISAISHASHYLVDILAGVAIAAFSIALVNRACASTRLPALAARFAWRDPGADAALPTAA